ncbi:DUF1826 domain-containing protein [Vibrio agarivorans]|uniref:DUF1826 domain-containing protein n=1 Tax=Vibrio agarivorans TaxID=153622 RepID=A0ABT7Y5J5_9VIBR|nr:DUF1826 domain-containing protein [Vibrio agarivorans]MDN2483324.1 DUF1826 domain-containing protein [Vibrio agarivorans]
MDETLVIEQAARAHTATDSISPLAIDTGPHALTQIYQAETNIAVWDRLLPLELTQDIEAMLKTGQSLALVQTVTPSDAAEWVRNKLSGHTCAKALGEDIALIVDMFCCLFDVGEAGLRLTTLDKPMCPKFHVDHVPCRLVTTYSGSATQWLENGSADRSKLGAGSQGMPDHLSGLYQSDSDINQLKPGNIALLKGSGWEGNESLGLIHRSPANLERQPRLLLTLDMV